MVKYRPLGASEERLFPVGQGANGFGSYGNHNLEAVRKRQMAIRYGLEQGIRFIDTAELYGGGFAEECLAPILAEQRQNVFLGTKFNARTPGTKTAVLHSLESSLQRLGTDYVDLFQLHYPHPSIPPEDVFEGMLQAVRQGKARFLGVSNFTVEETALAKAYLGDLLVSNQVEYNVIERSAELGLIPWASAQSMTIIAYSPLGQGCVRVPASSRERINPICQRYGCNFQQILLAWVLRHGHVIALTKTSHPAHQLENVAAATLTIAPEDLVRLDQNLKYPAEYIFPRQITPDSGKHRPTYWTEEQAQRNELSLIPSPADLATLLRSGHPAKSIRLIPPVQPRANYQLQPYDHFGELRKYWSWIIAYGWEKPMPALVAFNETEYA